VDVLIKQRRNQPCLEATVGQLVKCYKSWW